MKEKLLEILPWTEFLDVHLYKDTGIFVSNFAKLYKIPCDIVFCDNSTTGTKATEIEGVKLVKLENKYRYDQPPRLRQILKFFNFLNIFKEYIKSQLGYFSHVLLFHINPYTLYLTKFIKKLDPNIKIYVKADASCLDFKSKLIFFRLIKYVDLISFESEGNAVALQSKCKPSYISKIVYVPNGFDSESDDYKLSSLIKENKENIIISVARFGTEQKNTELLLDILNTIDLKGFKVILVGPVEESFEKYIKIFFEKKSNLKNVIQFVGNISSRQELYKLYKKSKIFVLTSRWESFGIVLMEAAWFGNSIISTNVGIAKALVHKMGYGFVAEENPNDEDVRQDLINSFAAALQKEIDYAVFGNELFTEKSVEVIQDEYAITKIVQKDCFKEFFTGVNY